MALCMRSAAILLLLLITHALLQCGEAKKVKKKEKEKSGDAPTAPPPSGLDMMRKDKQLASNLSPESLPSIKNHTYWLEQSWYDLIPTVKPPLEARGWKPVQERDEAEFIWVQGMYGILRPQVWCNHFPNIMEVGTKTNLAKNIHRAYVEKRIDVYKYFPRSYDLGDPVQRQQFEYDYERVAARIRNTTHTAIVDPSKQDDHSLPLVANRIMPPLQPAIEGKQNLWIIKPGNLQQGRGVTVCDSPEDCYKKAGEYEQLGPVFTERGRLVVVQKYVENPHLIAGRKYEIRLFVFVRALNPLIAFLYDDHFFLICSEPYREDAPNNKYVHITNRAVQKAHSGYSTQWPDNQFQVGEFRRLLAEGQGGTSPEDIVPGTPEGYRGVDRYDKVLLPRLKALVETTLEAWPKEGARPRSFALVAMDIVVDTNWWPWLCEINYNPQMIASPMKIKMVEEMFRLLFIEKDKDPGGWKPTGAVELVV